MTAVLKVEIMTLNRKSDSVNRCVLREEPSCQISSRSDLKRRELRLFEESPQQEEEQQQHEQDE